MDLACRFPKKTLIKHRKTIRKTTIIYFSNLLEKFTSELKYMKIVALNELRFQKFPNYFIT